MLDGGPESRAVRQFLENRTRATQTGPAVRVVAVHDRFWHAVTVVVQNTIGPLLTSKRPRTIGAMGTNKAGPIGADASPLVRFGDAMTARTILDAAATGARFSVVEHVIAPRSSRPPCTGTAVKMSSP